MKYYIFNLKRNCYERVCKDLDDLIAYFAHYNCNTWWSNKKDNSLFDQVSMNGKDKRYSSYWNGETYEVDYILRELMILDEYDRIIDPRIYKEKIFNYKSNRKYIPMRLRFEKWEHYEFRKGPVPGIRHKYRGHCYRHPQSNMERKLSSDPEIKLYVNPQRNYRNLPNTWDDIPISNWGTRKSWKKQKIERQWMKHINKHVDTIKPIIEENEGEISLCL